MHQPSPQLAPEGLPYIAFAAFLTLVLALLGLAVPAVVLLVVTALTLNFFRDPERVAPEDPAALVSPADGRVVKVGVAPDPFTGEPRKVVCVFMNVFNVHVNRCPVAARVERIRYVPGKFVNASLDKASTDNERCLLHVKDAEGRTFTVVQIAGLIARRIVCRAEPGDELARGERFGLIKFGSRVDLYLPEDYRLLVSVGDRTIAGETALATR